MISSTAAALCLTWIVSLALAQNIQVPISLKEDFTDKGVFRILQGGKEIGKENFQIQNVQEQWKCTADIRLQPKGQNPIEVHAETLLDSHGLFKSYEAQRTGDGPQMRIRVFLEEGIAICEEKGSMSSESTPVKVESAFQILDTNVFHHYAVLARRFTLQPGLQKVQVLIPQDAVAGDLLIKGTQPEIYKYGRNKIPVTRYNLDSGQLQLSIWADATGKLYRIQVPQTSAEVIRNEP